MHTSVSPSPFLPETKMLPEIRTTPVNSSQAYSPGPLGATPREMPQSLPSMSYSMSVSPSAYTQSESHAIARNRHAKGNVNHRKMVQ
jgi:hypothetical protein